MVHLHHSHMPPQTACVNSDAQAATSSSSISGSLPDCAICRALSPPPPPPPPPRQLLVLCSLLSKFPAVSSIMHLPASQGAISCGKMLPCASLPSGFVGLQDSDCSSSDCCPLLHCRAPCRGTAPLQSASGLCQQRAHGDGHHGGEGSPAVNCRAAGSCGMRGQGPAGGLLRDWQCHR